AEGWRQWHQAPGVTPRMLMIACREAYTYPTDTSVEATREQPVPDAAGVSADAPARDLDDTLEDLWRTQQARTRTTLDESHEDGRPIDEARLASGVVATLRLHDGVRVTVPAPSSPLDALKVQGPHGDVAVFVIQAAHHK